MKFVTVFVATLLVGSSVARAQEAGTYAPDQAAWPDTAAPDQLPPAPSYPSQPAPAVQTAAPQGQWVYTQQYGWVWMPYGSQYTSTPTQTGVYPSEYVYRPSYGWNWVSAPWVFGWGARPFFGVVGPSHYGWYNRAAAVGWRGYAPRPAYNYGRPAGGGFRTAHVGGFNSGGFHGGGFHGGGRGHR